MPLASILVLAGVISGVTLDWASGRPLSRTIVHLQPVPGSGSNLKPLQTRTGRAGQFNFPSVPDGLYLLETQREGFLPAAHGQRRPTGFGTTIEVNRDSSLFSELRLHRLGAITGTVLDENGIGIPRVNVVAYRAQLPLHVAGRGITDDRGVYRISGLALGKHWVRSTGHTLDDGAGLLPLFGPESREPRDAQIHEVRFDNDTPDANIRPEPGNLSTLSGTVVCDRGPNTPVTLTLSSEFSRQTVQAGCGGGYSFRSLAPAMYELFATYSDGTGSGFAERFIGQTTQIPVQVVSTSEVFVEVRSAATRSPVRAAINLVGRRDDLAGPDQPVEIPLRSAVLAPGFWQFSATPPPGQYITSIATDSDLRRTSRAARPSDWFPGYIQPFRPGERLRVTVSDRAAQLSGTVTYEAKRAPGIPVFLWPLKEETRRMLGGAKEALTDIQGRFQFAGLPPGDYRVLSTLDVREVNAAVVEEAQAKTISITEGQSAEVELPLWVAP